MILKKLLLVSLVSMLVFCTSVGQAAEGFYDNFNVAIYIPVSVVLRFQNPDRLEREWQQIDQQLKVDKVYIEVQRDRRVATDALLEQVKEFLKNAALKPPPAWLCPTAVSAVSSAPSAIPIPTTDSSSKMQSS